MTPPRSNVIAVVARDPEILRQIASAASELGHRLMAFASSTATSELLSSAAVDVIIAERRMDPIGGCELAELVQNARGEDRPGFVLVIDPTDFLDAGTAFDAVLWNPSSSSSIGDAIERAITGRAEARRAATRGRGSP